MNKIRLVIISGLLIGLSSVSFAQQTANANTTADATVVKPITITWNQPLAFGKLAPTATAGTAVIGVTGINVVDASYIHEAPVTTNCAAVPFGPNTYNGDPNPGPAVFTVTGQFNYHFGIHLPPVTTPMTITIANNTQVSPDMSVDEFASVVGNPGVVGATGTLSNGLGFQFFAVGAKLHVPANAIPGFYQGTFNVEVYYN